MRLYIFSSQKMILLFFLEASALQRRKCFAAAVASADAGRIRAVAVVAARAWRRVPSPEGGATDVRVKPITVTSS
jgi:hypothetical protein